MNIKYYFTFADYFNNEIKVNILGANFEGTATEVKCTADPLTISYPGDDRNVLKTIFGSEAKINLLSMTDFQFIDLHTSSGRDYRIDIYKNDVLFWKGWMLPDLFTEPYVAPPYDVSISARCGLGELKDIDIPETIEELTLAYVSNIKTQYPTLYSIIVHGLRKIETNLALKEAINLYHEPETDAIYSPLIQTTVNLEAYDGMSWHDVIDDILKPFGARLYQMSGQWWLVRIKEFKESLTVRTWDIDSYVLTAPSVETTKLTTFQINKPTGDFITGGAQLDILPAWQKLITKQELGNVDNIVKNPNFNIESGYDNILKKYIPAFWKYDNKPPVIFNIDGTPIFCNNYYGKQGIFYQNLGDFQVGTMATVEVNSNSFVPSINFYAWQRLLINLKYDNVKESPSNETQLFYIMVKYTTTTATYYLKYKDTSKPEKGFDWVTTESLISILNSSPKKFYTDLVFQDFTILTAPINRNGSIEIRFIEDASFGTICLQEVSARLTFIYNDEILKEMQEFQQTETTEFIIKNENLYTPETLETKAGDLPTYPNNERIWSYGFRTIENKPTEKWKERTGEEYPILKHLAIDVGQFTQQPQFKLSLPILSENINFDSCIVDYRVLPKKYICNRADFDIRNGIMTGTFIEFASWEGSKWILEDGAWDDDGIWIDNEIWNDE